VSRHFLEVSTALVQISIELALALLLALKIREKEKFGLRNGLTTHPNMD